MKRKEERQEVAAAVAEDTQATAAEVGDDLADAATLIEEDVQEVSSAIEEELRAEVEQWKDHARRAQAEFENTRKRLEARSVDEIKRAGGKIVTSIIPAIDDVELAMAHAAETGNDMADGLLAIHTKLLAALEREGVEIVNPEGEPFDSEFSQAVGVKETSEVPDQTVVEVLQRGYRLGGKTLRPAMVIVSKA
jgi:molecular chaperone GrpE